MRLVQGYSSVSLKQQHLTELTKEESIESRIYEI
jgi:hypothetical protein